MNLFVSLKQKSALFILTISLFVFLVSWIILRVVYLQAHEKYLENAFVELLEYMDSDFENIDEAVEWSVNSLNLKVYLFDNVDDLIVRAMPYAQEELISMSEKQELEQGNYVVKNIKATDHEINFMTLIYPVKQAENIDELLLTYIPCNNRESSGLPLVMASIGIVVFGICLFITQKSFQKSYNQLQDIKQAATEVSKGNYSAKIWKSSADELGEIVEVFNRMSTALKNDQERIKEFMEDISHEIKTPLTYIKTYNQALLDGIIEDPQEQHKSYHLIDRETSRLQKLIQTFLDFTKLDANAVELNKQPIVFAQSIEEIMMKYEPIFLQQQIQFKMLLDYDIVIDGDEERIEQIIQNIIQNAIRYSKEDPCIELKLSRNEDTCTLSISDNGVGISKEHLSIITNRFVRVNKVRSRKESGTGIGLSIVEKLMNLHGGEMNIESELGVGTTIKLTFPCIEI